jgi:hypothetical protein
MAVRRLRSWRRARCGHADADSKGKAQRRRSPGLACWPGLPITRSPIWPRCCPGIGAGHSLSTALPDRGSASSRHHDPPRRRHPWRGRGAAVGTWPRTWSRSVAAFGSTTPTTSRPSPSPLTGWNTCARCSQSTNVTDHPRCLERIAGIVPGVNSHSSKKRSIGAWLADVLARIFHYPAKRIGDLLPWNWRKRRPCSGLIRGFRIETGELHWAPPATH